MLDAGLINELSSEHSRPNVSGILYFCKGIIRQCSTRRLLDGRALHGLSDVRDCACTDRGIFLK